MSNSKTKQNSTINQIVNQTYKYGFITEIEKRRTFGIISHPDAEIELQKVLVLMNEYPKMKININAHTDSRQSTQNNQVLSENRAKSTMEWLIQNGISADRLTATGFGESQLINKCADGVKCNEEEHQANRRSEFIIVSM